MPSSFQRYCVLQQLSFRQFEAKNKSTHNKTEQIRKHRRKLLQSKNINYIAI
jgi:hypothetical protein